MIDNTTNTTVILVRDLVTKGTIAVEIVLYEAQPN